MNEEAVVELEAHAMYFFSPGDENAFFKWLCELKCVTGCVGRGKVLYISTNRAAVDEETLRELLALFCRYGVDMRQLCVFDNDKFSKWFRNKNSYWFNSVFTD